LGLRKRCSRTEPPTLKDGSPNPFFCPTSPRCAHHWHYDFRVNGRRYRNTTDTADKHKARDIEAKERSRILDGRHGIRRQPDITFRAFSELYLRDHADLHKRSADRDREILKTLNRAFGALILHEITAHRIEQFKRERLAGRWRGHGYTSNPKPLKPATVNRELETLKSILSKAVEWGKLVDSAARGIGRLKVVNQRTRILTPEEQRRVLEAAPRKMRALITLALITGARAGELLGLRWEHVTEDALAFLETKNGRPRRIPPLPCCENGLGGTTARSRPPVRVHECEDGRPLHRKRGFPRLSTCGQARRHRHARRDLAHAEAHGIEPDDRGAHRRLYSDGGLRTQFNANARALHASDGGTKSRCARDVFARAGHNPVTNRECVC